MTFVDSNELVNFVTSMKICSYFWNEITLSPTKCFNGDMAVDNQIAQVDPAKY